MNDGIQDVIFKQIREFLPSNVSLVHEISEILGISYDSAYRRIRGEKSLSIDELKILSTRFGISIDALFNIDSSNIVFDCRSVDPETFKLKDWLSGILKDIKIIHGAGEKQLIYAAKDPPMFHYFNFPEIAAFKLFLWQKTFFSFPEFADKRFRLDEADTEALEIGRQVLKFSTKIPTIEIWNEDTFNITMRQLEYYWVSGFFEKTSDVVHLCDKMEAWLRHIQKQAESGFKYVYGEPAEGIENSFQLYENEVVLNDNSIMASFDGHKVVYLTFNVLSLLTTTNPFFCNYVDDYLKGLLKKSTLISMVGAKERNRFFNKLFLSIDQFRRSIY